MDDKSLGDFRSDISRLPEEENTSPDMQGSIYHQEINTLKIEKLSQRITIISIILPCIIIAVLVFAYIDMKERVVDVDQSKGSQMAKVARDLETKLNALDVRIAKAKFELDEKLVLVEKKSQALENQAAKMSSAKADLAAVNKAMAKLEKRIKTNSGQDKATLAQMKKINGQLHAQIKDNNDRFKSSAQKIKDEIQLFKEEFDARLLELSSYEQQIAQLFKQTGLMDKKIKTLKQDTQISMEKEMAKARLSFEKTIKELKASMTAGPSARTTPVDKPSETQTPPQKSGQPSSLPPLPVSDKTGSISEQNLSQ
ncbi:MAG: hypothetical protein HUK40_21870 [Desulfobacter sp.]|nr:hypothetical protein [Desulfobacter sp.]WDP86272.1 MAG: hypothetical protein HUN05_15020 [Desulfobacter sp.]